MIDLYLDNEEKFREYLFTLQDLKYREFHKKIVMKYNVIGIRNDIIRDIAKKISKSDYSKYFTFNHRYYDEIIIHGLLIGYLKIDFQKKLQLLDEFLPLIDNWGVCDSVCAALKDFKKNQEEGYKYILKLIDSSKPFDVRVGMILLLSHFINNEYIDRIIMIIKNFDYQKFSLDNSYYVNMGISWLISICYIKFPDKTIDLFKTNNLSKFVHNKAISKICDSCRINEKDKENLKKYRIK